MTARVGIATVGLLAIAVAACSQTPAPVVLNWPGTSSTTAEGGGPLALPPTPEAKPQASAAAAGLGGTVTVVEGDTVHGIARRHQVSVRGLISVNGLVPPYVLLVGQQLKLPIERFHDVVAGDTLSGIARQYGVAMSSLARANGLSDPYVVVIGQRMRIPAGDVGEETSSPVTAATTSPTITVEAVPVPAAPEPTASTSSAEPTASGQGTAVVVEPVAAPAPPPEPVPPPEPLAPPVVPASATPAAVPQPAPRQEAKFAWPVEGQVVSSFGSKPGGLNNDGINIAAPRGTPVAAAENGIVVYAGNEVPGYGNLVLIRHADGWATAYAHNDNLLVKKGDKVARGQVIGYVGTTGNVATPQSHFEIRKGNEPVDPLPYLAAN